MANLFNEQRDRSWLLGRARDCVSKQPFLLIAFTAYWVWVNLLFQSPLLLPSLQTGLGLTLPLRLAPIGFACLAHLALSVLFRMTRFVIRNNFYIPLLSMAMITGGLLMIFWLEYSIQPSTMESAVFLPAPGGNSALATALYLGGAFLTGSASACLCIELQRAFGTLGSQYVLYIGCLAVVLSCLVLASLYFLPRLAVYALLAIAPVIIAITLPMTVRRIATRAYFTHGLSAQLIIPRKLLVTSVLHGLSIGVFIGLPPMLSSLSTLSLQCFVAFAVGAVLLFALSISIKMDYNHLLYQVGFPLVALGALCLVCFASVPLLGSTLQLVGFSFIHLVMWGVCTYLIKNLKLPATWTIGVSTCGFMFGQLTGALASMGLSQAEHEILSSQNLSAVIVFVALFASLLMMSSTNLRTGWGLVRPVIYEGPETGTDVVIEGLVAEYLLTERQASILLMITHGRSRRIISEELCISEETVKTHTRQLYRKLQVHSRQELIDLYEGKRAASKDEVRKPLFISEEPD